MNLFFLFGCGVKERPLRFPEKAIQSYIESYTQLNEEHEKNSIPSAQNDKKK